VSPYSSESAPADSTAIALTGLWKAWSHRFGATESVGMAVSRCLDQSYATVLFASSARARELEALQEATGVGPGPTALEERRLVLVDELQNDPRTVSWIGFVEPAVAHGVSSIHALPLQVGVTVLGLLTMHATERDLLATRTVPDLLRLGELATTALLTPQLVSPALASPDGGGQDFDLIDARHAVTHQATGMVSVQAGSSLADALALLRARAIATGRPLAEVARDVVAGRTNFRDTGQAPPSAGSDGQVGGSDDGTH
jgi:hypothetical protein